VVPPDQVGGNTAIETEGSAQQPLCNLKMAQVFEEKPFLREQLFDILRTCPEDSALKLQASRRSRVFCHQGITAWKKIYPSFVTPKL